jgi:hypothetical protein
MHHGVRKKEIFYSKKYRMDRTDHINIGGFNCDLAIFLSRSVQKLIKKVGTKKIITSLFCIGTADLIIASGLIVVILFKNKQYGSQTKTGRTE